MSLENLEKIIEKSLTEEKLKEYVGEAISSKMDYLFKDGISYQIETMIKNVIENELKPIVTAKINSLLPALNQIVDYELTEKFKKEIKNYSIELQDWKMKDSIRLVKK